MFLYKMYFMPKKEMNIPFKTQLWNKHSVCEREWISMGL